MFEFTFEEIENIASRKSKISKKDIGKRKKAFLYKVENGEVIFYSGEDAIKEKQKLVFEEDLSNITEIKGTTACKGVAQGKVIVFSWTEKDLIKKMDEMEEGSILVAGQTRPQLMPAIRKASGIITDEGGITSHAAIISRELGVPCIIGTGNATKILKEGMEVIVDADKRKVKILN